MTRRWRRQVGRSGRFVHGFETLDLVMGFVMALLRPHRFGKLFACHQLPTQTPVQMSQPLVGVVMGSRSDWEIMSHTIDTLEKLGIVHETRILSAHRTPVEVAEWASSAEERGLQVIIAAAGGAAHLGGVIAAHTVLPVLGVPMETSSLGGLDSLLSIVQMPGGVPVGTLSIGKAGAVNAALFACAILGVRDPVSRDAYRSYREERARMVLADSDPTAKGP